MSAAALTPGMAALALLFSPLAESEQWKELLFFWLPSERISDIERRTRAPLASWTRTGFLEPTPGAEIDLRPRLEINTDEVRAQHGATTGALDENLMFYLLARGIERPTARALLKWAFLGDVLRAIELPDVRRAAEHGAAGQLPDVMAIGALT